MKTIVKLFGVIIVFALTLFLCAKTIGNVSGFDEFISANVEALTDSETYHLVDCIIENNDNYDPRYDLHCNISTSYDYIYDCEFDFYTPTTESGKCVRDKY